MFCVFCGSPADGDTTISCPACGRTHYLHSKVAGSTLVVDGDRYLVVRRAAPPQAGAWDLPGGFCEYGEHPAAAAVRETLEESGWAVESTRLLGVWMDTYLEPDGRRWPTLNHVYLARPVAGQSGGGVVDPGEVAAVAWAPLASPPSPLAFPVQQLGALAAHAELPDDPTTADDVIAD